MDIKTYFISSYKVEGVENTSLGKCVSYLSDKDVVAIDIETSKNYEKIGTYNEEIYKGGLDPYLSNIVMLQLSDGINVYVIDVRSFTREDLTPIINFLHWNKKVTFVGQNLKFEAKHLKHKFGVELFKVHDCMIAEICLTNGLSDKSYSLSALAERYLGVPQKAENTLFEQASTTSLDDDIILENEFILTPYELANDEYIDKSTRLGFIHIKDRPFTKKQILYGADDVIYPLKIRQFQLNGRRLPNGTIYNPTRLFNLENNVVPVLAEIELNGLPFDVDRWTELAVIAEEKFAYREAQLNAYVLQHFPQFVEPPNLFDFEPRCTVEWTSSTQVIEVFKAIDKCPQEFSKQTKRKEYTVGAVSMLRLLSDDFREAYMGDRWTDFEEVDGEIVQDDFRLILNYLLFKKSEQLATTFGRKWLRYVHPITGKVHANLRQMVSSGRLASNSPNIQNLPAGDYRLPFHLKGGLVASSDYKNQEMRTAAVLSGESVMIDFFVKGDPLYGDDLHMSTANKMNLVQNPTAKNLPPKGDKAFGKEDNERRNRAKISGFSILYGKSVKGFALDWNVEEEEAEMFVSSYLGAYPNLSSAMEQWRKESFKNGYIMIDTTLDRRWFSPMFAEMEEVNEEVRSYYPPEYFKRGRMTADEKARVKQEVTESYPEVKGMWRNFFGMKGNIERRSVNYRVQGGSAAQSKAALVLMRKAIVEKGLPYKLCNAIHDEIMIWTTDTTKKEELKEFMQSKMNEGANLFLNPPIMLSDCEVGDHWIH